MAVIANEKKFKKKRIRNFYLKLKKHKRINRGATEIENI